MADWRKTQYRIGPKRDPLDDPMAGENLWFGLSLWSALGAMAVGIVLLVGGVGYLLFRVL